MTDLHQRAIGALLGAAVGDALGAPFEFGPPGAYRARFPEPPRDGAGEMIGGGPFGWEPGEFTDDTQMAVVLVESLLDHGGFDADDLWRRWRAWASTANDVGNTIRSALRHESRSRAAAAAHQQLGQSAGNGALMRTAPVALLCVGATRTQCMGLALAQAALTHHDPAAGWGAAIGAEAIRVAIRGDDPLTALADILASVPPAVRGVFVEMLSSDWEPTSTTLPNGSVWSCLAQAVWAVRTTSTFEDAVVAAIDLGADTDTVACVTGALAGAVHGAGEIPHRWVTPLHGRVTTPEGESHYDSAQLQLMALQLLEGGRAAPSSNAPMAPRAGLR